MSFATDVTNTPPPKRGRVKHPEGGISRTRQADAMETDINRIVERYVAHGVLPKPPGTARYGDFSNQLDYKDAMDRVTAAKSQFMELPSHIRKHVNNDPGQFLDMVFDQARRGELEELGLLPQSDPTLPAPAAQPEALEGETEATNE